MSKAELNLSLTNYSIVAGLAHIYTEVQPYNPATVLSTV